MMIAPAIDSMRAVVADGKTAEFRASHDIRQPSEREVVVEVRATGLCRTDLYVASGQIQPKQPVIPGHEFSGIVVRTGPGVTTVQTGQHVTVNPVIPCRRCEICQANGTAYCQAFQFLGLDRDGACAEYVVVPVSAIIPLPNDLPFLVAAFAEPVAASLAVLKADIHTDQRGLVFGHNRIARLTHRILETAGFDAVSVCGAADSQDLPGDHFDFIIETIATTEAIGEMMRLVRPRGRIVFKSRQHQPVQLTLREILVKEPVFEAVNYGRFDEAVDLLATSRIRVDDLIGNCYPLEQFQAAFAEALADDQSKTFVIPREGI